jgi:hypothetical protein
MRGMSNLSQKDFKFVASLGNFIAIDLPERLELTYL